MRPVQSVCLYIRIKARGSKHTQAVGMFCFRNAFRHRYVRTCKANINLDSHVDKNGRERDVERMKNEQQM